MTFRWAAVVGGIPGESRSDLPPTRTRTALAAAAAAGGHPVPAICELCCLRRPACCAACQLVPWPLGTRASPGPSVNFVSSITQYTVALMATGSNKH